MSNLNLDAIARQVRALEKKNVGNIVKIGELLSKVRDGDDGLKHGEYMEWVSREFVWSYRTALRYRYAYHFAEKCPRGTFDKLNLSISALHLVADPATGEKEQKAITRAALKGRVTKAIALDIIEKCRPADSDVSPSSPPPIEPLPEESGRASPAASASPGKSNPVQLLQSLGALVHEDHDWTVTIEALGPARIREIVNGLKAVLDRYSQDKAVKAMADRAEARLKSTTARENQKRRRKR
jgi:hypothetical protein